MLEQTYKCDRRNCTNTTPKTSPSSAWKVVLWLTAHLDLSDNNTEKHYCSEHCLRNPLE